MCLIRRHARALVPLNQAPIASVILAFFQRRDFYFYMAQGPFFLLTKARLSSIYPKANKPNPRSAFNLPSPIANPHVYLDTVVIIGSIAGTIAGMEGKILFKDLCAAPLPPFLVLASVMARNYLFRFSTNRLLGAF